MLDDVTLIHQRDAHDALGIAGKQWQQLEYAFDLSDLSFSLENVVFSGMGGSALGAEFARSWPGVSLPFEIVRDYDVPEYASNKTLFIASSYSGNTEETLNALNQAEQLGCQIVCISAGGKLVEIAKAKGYPLAELPKVSQPRFATFYSFKALVTILDRAGLVKEKDVSGELGAAADFLKDQATAWLPDMPTEQNQAKQLALELAGTSPVIYAGARMFPAAYKWKISFNENAKNVAWCNKLPEFSHNEFIGWTSHPVDKPYGVVDLRSSFEHPRVQKRFTVSERLLSGKRPPPHVVEAQGSTLLEHLLFCSVLGDFVSIYVALLNNVDPTPVALIETMKQALDS